MQYVVKLKFDFASLNKVFLKMNLLIIKTKLSFFQLSLKFCLNVCLLS